MSSRDRVCLCSQINPDRYLRFIIEWIFCWIECSQLNCRRPILNQIFNWINYRQNSNIELNQTWCRSGLSQMLTWLYSERRWPIELGEFLPASLGHLHSDPFIRIVLICISKATTTVQCSWHDFQGGHLGFDIYQSQIFAGIRKFVVTLLDPTAPIPHLDSMSPLSHSFNIASCFTQ